MELGLGLPPSKWMALALQTNKTIIHMGVTMDWRTKQGTAFGRYCGRHLREGLLPKTAMRSAN